MVDVLALALRIVLLPEEQRRLVVAWLDSQPDKGDCADKLGALLDGQSMA